MLPSERDKIQKQIEWLEECSKWYPDTGVQKVIYQRIGELKDQLENITESGIF
jgi:hypothetical protein